MAFYSSDSSSSLSSPASSSSTTPSHTIAPPSSPTIKNLYRKDLKSAKHGRVLSFLQLKNAVHDIERKQNLFISDIEICTNKDCSLVPTSSVLELLEDRNRALLGNTKVKIDIYLRIMNTKTVFWSWMNNEYFGSNPFHSCNKATVARVRLSSKLLKKELGLVDELHSTVDWKMKALINSTCLQYHTNSKNAPKHNESEIYPKLDPFLSTRKPDPHINERLSPSSYSYLKMWTMVGNISNSHLLIPKPLLNLEALFFSDSLCNMPYTEERSKKCILKNRLLYIQNKLQIHYVLTLESNCSAKEFMGKEERQEGNNGFMYHKRHRRSYDQIIGEHLMTPEATFSTTEKNLNEPSEVINSLHKSQQVRSTPDASLLKQSQDNAGTNTKNALSNSYLYRHDLQRNKVTLASNSLSPSSTLPLQSLWSKTLPIKPQNIYSFTKPTRKKQVKSRYNQQQPATPSQLTNEVFYKTSSDDRNLCRNLLFISSASSMIKVSDGSTSSYDNDLHRPLFDGLVKARAKRDQIGDINESNDAIKTNQVPETHFSDSIKCSAQIRLPFGYRPRLKVIPIQGKLNKMY